MREITIRIYSGDDMALEDEGRDRVKLNYFDLRMDGEVYSDMRHLTIDVSAPERDEKGSLCVDDTKVSVSFEKNFNKFSYE